MPSHIERKVYMKMKKTYSIYMKNKIISLFRNGKSVVDIINEYTIPKSTLYGWISKTNLIKGKSNNNITYDDYTKIKTNFDALSLELSIIRDSDIFSILSRQEKLAIIESLFGKYPTKTMCAVIGVDPGTFYNHHLRKVTKTQYEINDDFLKPKILQVFKDSEERFGSRKIGIALRSQNITVSDKKVYKLMQDLKIEPNLPSKKVIQKKPNNIYLVNRVNRVFKRNHPNQAWVGDVTFLTILNNSFFLCVIIDLFSRKVIAHRIHVKNNTNLTMNTLRDAFEERQEPVNVIFHSDRGANYTSYEYQQLLKSLSIKPSFSNTGNPYDNAVVESFFSYLKKEETNRYEYETIEELRESVDKYIKFYNSERPHHFLKGLTPDTFEANYYSSNEL